MEKILCSACLLGVNCCYDGENRLNSKVYDLTRKYILIPVCPEQLGGLPTPRKPAGIYGSVSCGIPLVLSVGDGEDLTKHFIKGAEEVLTLAKRLEIKKAILKQKSPSCGCGKTWQLDDKYENHVVEGDGVTTQLLKIQGISVITEEDL